jgi:spore germination protein GerM
LTIVEGVATADFTKEMTAYGGGSARVNAIQEQITLTLKQFPSVKEVRILVDGKLDALQP